MGYIQIVITVWISWSNCYCSAGIEPITIPPVYIPHNSITLTPENNGEQGAILHSLSETNEVVSNVHRNQWEMQVTSTHKWLMNLHLDKTWGFHPYRHSTLNLTINSPSIAGKDTFNEFLIGFTVPTSNKYIMVCLLMAGGQNKIIPPTGKGYCDTRAIPLTLMSSGDITNLNNTDIQDLLYSSKYKGRTMMPSNAYYTPPQYNGWPITITLQNHPPFATHKSAGFSLITYKSDTFTTGFMQQCGFESFSTDNGLDIYFTIQSSKILAIK
eukprot:464628_1